MVVCEHIVRRRLSFCENACRTTFKVCGTTSLMFLVVRLQCIPRLDDTYALRNVVDYAAQRHGVTALAILQPFIVELDMGATVAQLSVFLGL